MTDDEFNVLDELYFVIAHQELLNELEYDPAQLNEILISLYDKGWIKILSDVDTDLKESEISSAKLNHCFFLATKHGLLAHNS